MRKLILLFAVTMVLFACEKYDEYEVESAGYTTVYFPTQELSRSAISGEGLEIKIGAYLGGVRENAEDRTVSFQINDTLLGTNYTLLPADYYTLSNASKITIPAGEFLGMIDVKFDSTKIAADSLLLDFNYAIPLEITSTSADSILEGKEFTVIPIKMINTFEGNFYQVGQVKKFFTVKHVLDDAYLIGDTLDYPKSPIRQLKTSWLNKVTVDGIADFGGGGFTMDLTVNADNSVNVSTTEGAVVSVEQNGSCTWDPIHRIFDLNYKFTYNDRNYEVKESLIFRNRMRDGINEWRWEGFPGN